MSSWWYENSIFKKDTNFKNKKYVCLLWCEFSVYSKLQIQLRIYTTNEMRNLTVTNIEKQELKNKLFSLKLWFKHVKIKFTLGNIMLLLFSSVPGIQKYWSEIEWNEWKKKSQIWERATTTNKSSIRQERKKKNFCFSFCLSF